MITKFSVDSIWKLVTFCLKLVNNILDEISIYNGTLRVFILSRSSLMCMFVTLSNAVVTYNILRADANNKNRISFVTEEHASVLRGCVLSFSLRWNSYIDYFIKIFQTWSVGYFYKIILCRSLIVYWKCHFLFFQSELFPIGSRVKIFHTRSRLWLFQSMTSNRVGTLCLLVYCPWKWFRYLSAQRLSILLHLSSQITSRYTYYLLETRDEPHNTVAMMVCLLIIKCRD